MVLAHIFGIITFFTKIKIVFYQELDIWQGLESELVMRSNQLQVKLQHLSISDNHCNIIVYKAFDFSNAKAFSKPTMLKLEWICKRNS